jgi:hypothetical protein
MSDYRCRCHSLCAVVLAVAASTKVHCRRRCLPFPRTQLNPWTRPIGDLRALQLVPEPAAAPIC